MDLDGRPLLHPEGRVILRPPNEIILLTDLEVLRLTGELFAALAPYLDGSQTISAISEQMTSEGLATTDEVIGAIEILAEKGFVTDQRYCSDSAEIYQRWWPNGVSERENAAQTKPRLAIVGVGEVPLAQLCHILAAHGLQIVDEMLSATYVVIIADDYLNPEVGPIALAAQAAGIPVLIANVAGPRPTVGPWLGDPGPCWECLASRLRFNRQAERSFVGPEDRMGPVVRGWTSATIGLSAGDIALEIDRTHAGLSNGDAHANPSIALMRMHDHLTGARTLHYVVRRPQCGHCGTPVTVESVRTELVLTSDLLDATNDGSYRRLAPERTLANFEHHVSPVTGVVEQLFLVDDSPVIHVAKSGVNLATGLKGGRPTGFRSLAGGKGTSAIQAKAGALAEAIERYSACYNGEEPAISASLRGLGEDAIDPRDCMLFSEHQYETRESWNSTAASLHRVPMRFDPDTVMPFAPAWSLTDSRRVWVPVPWTHFNYPNAMAMGCKSDSNGNAAGTSIEDAVLQGFFELVERDAASLWWYNRASRPAVDIDSYVEHYQDTYIDRLRNYYSEHLDRDVWALDLTSDMGIPTVVAVSQARSGLPRLVPGFGAHRDPRTALLRALTEMNQLANLIPHMEQSECPEPGDHSQPDLEWWFAPDAPELNYLRPSSGRATTPVDHPHDWNADGGANVQRVVDLLRNRGLNLTVLDMTRPDIGLPVVKVIVPGMRSWFGHFAPGRLYDVPVQLGWLEAAVTEHELNPIRIMW